MNHHATNANNVAIDGNSQNVNNVTEKQFQDLCV